MRIRKRKYTIIFKKYFYSFKGNKSQYDSHFVVKSLKSNAIKRRFDDNYEVIENMIVKKGKKVIYEGNDYNEFLKVVEKYEQSI